MNVTDVLTDLVSRPLYAARSLPRLSADQLAARPGGHPNSIAWLLWHSGREIDIQLADLTGEAQQWERFRDRFDLGPLGDTMGYGHTPEQAEQIRVDDQDLLIDYLQATLDALLDYARSLDDAQLDEVVDRRWEPAVTRGARLISLVDDAIAHVAQAAYAAGALSAPQP